MRPQKCNLYWGPLRLDSYQLHLEYSDMLGKRARTLVSMELHKQLLYFGHTLYSNYIPKTHTVGSFSPYTTHYMTAGLWHKIVSLLTGFVCDFCDLKYFLHYYFKAASFSYIA